MNRSLVALTASIVATLASGAVFADARRSDSTSDVVGILVEHRLSGETDTARRALAELGPDAVPAICSVLSGRTTGAEHGFEGPLVDPPTRTVLVEAMRTWPTEAVVERLVATLDGDVTLSDRLRIVDLIGELGGRGSLAAIFDQLEALDPGERQHRIVTSSFSAAFERIARRDSHVVETIAARLHELDPALLPGLATTLGELSVGSGLDILERMLRRSSQIDVAVLQAVGHWKPWKPEYVEGDCAGLARSLLHSSDHTVRRQAVITLGELGDVESVPDMIERLSDPDRSVQQAAQRALQEISGLRWTADASRWQRWFAEENAWFEATAPDLERLGNQRDPAAFAAILQQARLHPVFGDRLARTIIPLLEHPASIIATSAAQALGRLGHPSAVYPLVRALEDDRPDVKAAVQNALRNLTRMGQGDLSADEWRERLDA